MIRAAQTGEVSAITELLELAIGGTQRPEQVQAWIDDPNRVVLVDHLSLIHISEPTRRS